MNMQLCTHMGMPAHTPVTEMYTCTQSHARTQAYLLMHTCVQHTHAHALAHAPARGGGPELKAGDAASAPHALGCWCPGLPHARLWGRKQSHDGPPAPPARSKAGPAAGTGAGAAPGAGHRLSPGSGRPHLVLAVPTLTVGVTRSRSQPLRPASSFCGDERCSRCLLAESDGEAVIPSPLCGRQWATRCPTRVHPARHAPATWEDSALKEALSCKPVTSRDGLVWPSGLSHLVPSHAHPRLCRWVLPAWAGTQRVRQRMAGVRPLV